MSIFEATMLACFGAAWPFSLYKSYTSRSNVGKSIFFFICCTYRIFFGYIAQINLQF